MGALEPDGVTERIDALPKIYQQIFKEYLIATEKTGKWLKEFPLENEFLLQIFPIDLLRAATPEGQTVGITRNEKPDEIGGLILELMYRRSVTIEAIKTGEQKLPGIGNYKNDKILTGSTINELLNDSQNVTKELFELFSNLSEEDVDKKWIKQKNGVPKDLIF